MEGSWELKLAGHSIHPLYLQKERVSPQPLAQRVFPFFYSSCGQKQEWNKSFLSPL